MPVFPVLPLMLVGLAAAACLGLLILLAGLQRVFAVAPRLTVVPADQPRPAVSLTVVIPAYNEAANIEACVSHVLASAAPCASWQLVVVDDDSTDATTSLAAAAAAAGGGPPERCRVLQAGPRPADQRWVGKNWACTQAAEQTESDWLLFIDADVRLQPDALRRALTQAQHDQADLLSLAPRLGCSCLSEWMVQPIMASLLGLGFPIQAANDPTSPVAFAAGPFMLFRRSVYEQIGGHRALAAEVVEDLALARRIKGQGYRLRYLLGLDVAELNMYANFAALWEGWSKNWFLGLDSSVPKALAAAGVVVLMFSGPWLLLGAGVLLSWWMPLERSWWLAVVLLSGVECAFAAGPAAVEPQPISGAAPPLVVDGSRWPVGGGPWSHIGVAHPHRPRMDLERAIPRLMAHQPITQPRSNSDTFRQSSSHSPL